MLAWAAGYACSMVPYDLEGVLSGPTSLPPFPVQDKTEFSLPKPKITPMDKYGEALEGQERHKSVRPPALKQSL
eukprot:scaffold46101_cov21-Tisochrysis_lutea.AAC.1